MRRFSSFVSVLCGWSLCWMFSPLQDVCAQEGLFTLAGTPGESGSQDGGPSVSSFNVPSGIAVTAEGSIYIADHAGHIVRVIDPEGNVGTLAGRAGVPGYSNGIAESAMFSFPAGLVSSDENLFLLADSGNHCIRSITTEGVVSLYCGVPGKNGWQDGSVEEAEFHSPAGVALDRSGNLIVADSGNHLIRKISMQGDVTTVAGVPYTWGYRDGPANQALFHSPVAVVSDEVGNIFVSDANNFVIRKISVEGTVSTIAGVPSRPGFEDGISVNALLSQPAGLAVGKDRNLYIADTLNHAVRRYDGKQLLTIAGYEGKSGKADGINGEGTLFNPYDLAFAPTGELFISDAYNHLIRNCFVPFTLNYRRDSARLSWASIVGNHYVVEFKAGLAESGWRDIETIVAESVQINWTAPGSLRKEQGLFRVRVVPAFSGHN